MRADRWTAASIRSLLMYSADGDSVTLGLDRYCPRVLERLRDPAVARLADEVATLLDGPLRAELLARRGLVGGWKEHVEPLRALPRPPAPFAAATWVWRGFSPPRASAWTRSSPRKPARSPITALPRWSSGRTCSTCTGKPAATGCLSSPTAKVTASFSAPLGQGPAAPAAQEGLAIVRALNPSAPSPRIQEADDFVARELEASGWHVRETAVESFPHRVV